MGGMRVRGDEIKSTFETWSPMTQFKSAPWLRSKTVCTPCKKKKKNTEKRKLSKHNEALKRNNGTISIPSPLQTHTRLEPPLVPVKLKARRCDGPMRMEASRYTLWCWDLIRMLKQINSKIILTKCSPVRLGVCVRTSHLQLSDLQEPQPPTKKTCNSALESQSKKAASHYFTKTN